MMTQDQISAILTKENKAFFKMFNSVDEYMAYRSYAASIVKVITDVMHNPQSLIQISEAITGDKPYILTFVNQKFVTGLGASLNEYLRKSTEHTLRAAHDMSLGAICWEVMENEDADYYFIWVEPEDIKARWTNLIATMEKIGMQINKDAEEEADAPDYEEHFAETPSPDLTMN